jgi:hypothetical protein
MVLVLVAYHNVEIPRAMEIWLDILFSVVWDHVNVLGFQCLVLSAAVGKEYVEILLIVPEF